MKLRPFALCLLLTPALLRASAVDSKIIAATVYPDRAVVSRLAHINASVGQDTLLFENLPEGLDDDSLQVSASGDAEAAIVDVNSARAYIANAPDPRAQALEDEIKDLANQAGVLEDRASVLGEERNFVKRMLVAETVPASGDSAHLAVTAPRPSLEEWQKLFGYSDESLSKIAAELRAIEEKKSDISDKKTAAQKQLADLKGTAGRSVKNVTVRIDAAKGGTLDLVLKYSVRGARWAPSYDARLRTTERAVDLSYYGLVRNLTGEDWNEIALTLSTARPSLGGGAPELTPWVVDVEQPRDVGAAAFSKSIVTRDARMYGGMRAKDEEDKLSTLSIQADVELNATSATFKVRDPVSIPADNSMQKVPIASSRLVADLRYEASPKLLEAAFLTATAHNSSGYPYLAGAMNTFLDGTFIAASRLGTVMPGEKFELHLGVDDAIAVTRKLVNRFAEGTGLTNSGKRVTYDILVTVTNNRRTPEKVTFREPLPLSRNEKVVVTLITPDESEVGTKEAPKEVIREDSKLVWTLELKPGEKREVPIKFSVSYPADITVTGLD